MKKSTRSIMLTAGLLATGLMGRVSAATIYSHSFSGDGATPLVGKAPDVAPAGETWQGLARGSQWMADGSITNTTWERRNLFLPFKPEPGKIYTLKIDVVRIGTLNTFCLGFTKNANFTGGFPLVTDNVGASPWMVSAAINGKVNTFMGPNAEGEGQQVSVPNPDSMNTLQMVLNMQNPTWTVEFFLNGYSIHSAPFSKNPEINYVGFGRYNQGTFRIDNFELSVASE